MYISPREIGGTSKKSKNQNAKRQSKNKSKVKEQNEEGFYSLICHFDFLCLIFDIVRDLELGI